MTTYTAASASVQPDPIAATTWDAIIIGSGMGGLVTATQLASKGAKVLVLERYTIPGGSGGYLTYK